MTSGEIYIPATSFPEIHPKALTLGEFELLTGISGFEEKVMSVLLGYNQNPEKVIKDVRNKVIELDFDLDTDICIAELPGFKSNNSIKRTLLGPRFRETEAMIAIGLYNNFPDKHLEDSDKPFSLGSHFPRNPRYKWYHRLREKQKRREQRQINIQKRKGHSKNNPTKSDRGTGNRPLVY